MCSVLYLVAILIFFNILLCIIIEFKLSIISMPCNLSLPEFSFHQKFNLSNAAVGWPCKAK